MDAICLNPWAGVVINEFLAHTDDPVLDFIELYNSRNTPVDLSGCFLSDDPKPTGFESRTAPSYAGEGSWLSISTSSASL